MRRTLLALALCASFTLHAESTSKPQFLEVSLNQRPTNQTITFWSEGGVLIASTEDWKALGVVLKPSEEGKTKLSSSELGATIKLDEDAQTVDIVLPPERLPAQELSTNGRPKLKLADPASGVLVNYNLSGTKTYPGTYEGVSLAHDIHFPLLGGVMSTTGQLNYNTLDGAGYRRLYSTWEKDDYGKLQSFQVGDVFATGPASTIANLAGFRWTKDPAGLDPFTPTYALPNVNGLVVDAGTLQVLANESPIARSDVSRGPFQLDRVAAQAGLNTLQAVVQDGYGRQTVVSSTSYYVAPTTLRAGLDTWDFSAGLLRRNYSDSYKGLGASFRYSKGWTDNTTWTIQGQASSDGENAAGTLVHKLGNAGVITATGALSEAHGAGQTGMGWYSSVGYEFHSANWGVNFQRYQSDNFYQLRDPSLSVYQPKSSTILGASWTSPNRGFNAQLNYNDLVTSYSRYRQVMGSLGWSSHGHHLNASVGYDFSHHSPSFMLSYNYTFKSVGLSASYGANDGMSQAQVSGSWSHLSNTGTQVQANATALKTDFGSDLIASGSITTAKGTGRINIENGSQAGSVSGSWGGAMIWAGGGPHFTQYSPTGYVVVEVPTLPGIPVTSGGRVVSTTNSKGVAVIGGVPSLAPINIGLDDKSIPMGVEIKDTSRIIGVPKLGGANAKFDVETMDGRTFHILHDGQDIEQGATTDAGDITGFHGKLYLEHPPLGKTMKLTLPAYACVVQFPTTLPAYGKEVNLECK